MGLLQHIVDQVPETGPSLTRMRPNNFYALDNSFYWQITRGHKIFPYPKAIKKQYMTQLTSDIFRILKKRTAQMKALYRDTCAMRREGKGKKMIDQEIEEVYGVTRNFKGLEELIRSSPKRLGLRGRFRNTCYSPGMSIYIHALHAGTSIWHSTAAALLEMLEKEVEELVSEQDEIYPNEHLDDSVRKMVKDLDDVGFRMLKSKPYRELGLLLNGITTMGGPRGWRKETLVENCKEWVTGDKIWGARKRPYIESKIESWFTSWVMEQRDIFDSKMTFEEYCADPMKWATGGGSKKKKMPWTHTPDDVFRTKWAWAISNIGQHGFEAVYEQAKMEPNVAMVALKEETKTRLVITTPMASYLRQSYILYRLNTPNFLKSTLTSQDHLNHMAGYVNYNYVCIDASRFDQNFPGWMVRLFFSRLRDIIRREKPDDELIGLIEEEIASLDDLKVEIMGNVFCYESGLLSGWRITSILGSIASALLCEYINEQLGMSMMYLTQGDDIIMMSVNPVDESEIVSLCEEFGVNTHPDKCMFGEIGEFLKFTYMQDRIVALPARAVRSLVYINPWMDKTVARTPQDIIQNWYNLISRMYVSVADQEVAKTVLNLAIKDIHGWAQNKFIIQGGKGTNHDRIHLGVQKIKDLLRTPQGLGGLGCWETSGYVDGRAACVTYSSMKAIQQRDVPADEQFLAMFGVQAQGKRYTYKAAVQDSIYHMKNIGSDLPMRSETQVPVASVWMEERDSFFGTIVEMVCRFQTFPTVELLRKRMRESKCVKVCWNILKEENWPVRIRYRPRWQEAVGWVMGVTQLAMPISLFVDSRYDFKSTFKAVLARAEKWYTTTRHMRKGDLWVATCFLHRVMASSSSWLHSL